MKKNARDGVSPARAAAKSRSTADSRLSADGLPRSMGPMNVTARRVAALCLGLGILSVVGFVVWVGGAHRAEQRAQDLQFAVAHPGGEGTLVTLAVEGMTCPDCAKSVSEELSKVAGVTAARVDLDRQVAEVRLATADVAPAALLEAVADAGYDAKVEPAAAP
jgi:copper chaperone CopZ